MRWRRAAKDRTCPHSGKVPFGIVLPEVVPLGVWVIHMRLAHAQPLLQDDPIPKHCTPQVGPILPLATTDHVIDGGKGKVLMVQMAVDHEVSNTFALFDK